MRRLLPSLLAACVLCLAPPGLARSGETQRVDLELVLAVDVSLSMDADEQRLQREGYVAAFRDPAVHRAIASGAGGRIAVAYIEWAGEHAQETVVPWTLIDGPPSAEAFVAQLDGTDVSRLRGTSISSALNFTSTLFVDNGYQAMRQVIDVSGDGQNNMGSPVLEARAAALDKGITINGLPIMLHTNYDGMFSIGDLDIYYENCVIGGPGAFLVTVETIDRLAEAIRRKLVLEIAGLPARIVPAQVFPELRPDYDCMIGERLRRRWMVE